MLEKRHTAFSLQGKSGIPRSFRYMIKVLFICHGINIGSGGDVPFIMKRSSESEPR